MTQQSYEQECAQLRSYLVEHPWGQNLVCLPEVESTNLYAKTLAAADAPEGSVVISDRQSAGRGQKGRSFASPPQLGLYISFILRPKISPERMQPFTLMAGVAACNAIERVSGIRPQLKWPNDVFLDGKKLGGILTERTLSTEGQCIILGIGINLNHSLSDFPTELHEIAGSLHMKSGRLYDRAALAAAIIEEVYALSEQFEALITPYLQQYRADCLHLNQDVTLYDAQKTMQARCVDIDKDGALLIEYPDGRQERCLSGELRIKI